MLGSHRIIQQSKRFPPHHTHCADRVSAHAKLFEILERKLGRATDDAPERRIDMPLDRGMHIKTRLRRHVPAGDKDARQRGRTAEFSEEALGIAWRRALNTAAAAAYRLDSARDAIPPTAMSQPPAQSP